MASLTLPASSTASRPQALADVQSTTKSITVHEAEPNPSKVVSKAVFFRGLRVVLMIMAAALVAATIVSFAVLPVALRPIGFFIAFLMIMFIGLPLILASIQDAIESHE